MKMNSKLSRSPLARHAGQTKWVRPGAESHFCLFFSVDSICSSLTYSGRLIRRFVCLLLFVFNLYDCGSLFLLINFVELSELWVTLFPGFKSCMHRRILHGVDKTVQSIEVGR